jgi:hypothetical protein
MGHADRQIASHVVQFLENAAMQIISVDLCHRIVGLDDKFPVLSFSRMRSAT